MANIKDTYTFLHDANARNDERILMLRAEFGMEGYGWYFAVIEMLREANAYQLQSNCLPGFALSLGMTKDRFSEMLEFAVRVELLERSETHFWSPSLLRRMDRYDQKRERLRVNGSKCKANAKQMLSNCSESNKQIPEQEPIPEQEQEQEQDLGGSGNPLARKAGKVPAYALPDRFGNERKPHPGWKSLWFSDRELELLRKKFISRGLREEFHSEAYRKVSVWFSESPSGRKQYPKSACHADRVGDFGLTEALKAQATSDNAKAAAGRASNGGYAPKPEAKHPSCYPPPGRSTAIADGPAKDLLKPLVSK